jgi:hypothetical protein
MRYGLGADRVSNAGLINVLDRGHRVCEDSKDVKLLIARVRKAVPCAWRNHNSITCGRHHRLLAQSDRRRAAQNENYFLHSCMHVRGCATTGIAPLVHQTQGLGPVGLRDSEKCFDTLPPVFGGLVYRPYNRHVNSVRCRRLARISGQFSSSPA